MFTNVPKSYADQLVFIQEWLVQKKEQLEDARDWYQEKAVQPASNTIKGPAIRRRNEQLLDHSHTVLQDGIFGCIELQDDDNLVFQYSLGDKDIPKAGVIAAWHPVAKIFYEGDFGEYFEVKKAGERVEVAMASRVKIIQRNFDFERAKASYEDEEFDLSIAPQEDASVPVMEGQKGGLVDVRALLTPEQYRQIASASQKPLIIQGKAGSGKTTVGLYRLSFLAYNNPDEGIVGIDPEKLLIITYNIALNNYVKSHLADIGLEKASLFPFYAWADKVLSGAYNGVIQKLGSSDLKQINGYQDSLLLKDQLEVLNLIDEHVKVQAARLAPFLRQRWQEKNIPEHLVQEWIQFYEDSSDKPFLRRIVDLRTALKDKRNTLQAAYEVSARNLEKERELGFYNYLYNHVVGVYKKMSNYKRDMRFIFCDLERLKRHFPRWEEGRLKRVVHFNDQLIRRLAGSKMNVGPCVGYDDIPILIRIIQVKHGGLTDKSDNVYHYDHVFVDEAQDFGAVALKVLMSTVHSRTGVTMVGDKNQKIFHNATFVDWGYIAKELGIPSSEVNNLTVSHRSEPEITQFCDWILGEPVSPLSQPSDVNMPYFIRSSSVERSYEILFEEVLRRWVEEPDKHHAIIVNWPREVDYLLDKAQKYYQKNNAEVPLRKGYQDSFVFTPGVTVTNRQQIKGLEFDSVFIFEPSPDSFPKDEIGRCNLYTVASRPRERLGFFASKVPSLFIEEAIQDGLILDLSVPPEDLDEDDLDMDF
ncbi:MAG: UvrD-helicase domain-containing protein [Myxococcota bacterium]|nr:UvrD-helicase domain-containing protein [Myxococcota bacterium]